MRNTAETITCTPEARAFIEAATAATGCAGGAGGVAVMTWHGRTSGYCP